MGNGYRYVYLWFRCLAVFSVSILVIKSHRDIQLRSKKDLFQPMLCVLSLPKVVRDMEEFYSSVKYTRVQSIVTIRFFTNLISMF